MVKQKVQVWIINPKEKKALLFLTNKSRGSFWQPITGSVEDFDKNLTTAAERELLEETGFKLTAQSLNQSFVFTDQYGNSVQEYVFVCLSNDLSKPHLDPHEHDSYMWCTFESVADKVKFESNKQMFKVCLSIYG